eukprot:3958193-Amphidinium_carterae.2
MAAVHYHKFPMGQVKVIQQLMVTKTHVCANHHPGCVAASIHHLGIYALMIPVESLGRAVAATHDLSWVDELQQQDVISMCNVRESMNEYYATQGRNPDFPMVANPNFNPDVDFRFNDHSQSVAPRAQQNLMLPLAAPRIIQIGDNAPRPQQNQLNEQNMQTWNAQYQTNTMQNAQMQPTPLISMNSQPMQSTQMPYSPPGMTQPQQPQFQMQQMQMQPQAYVSPQPQPQQHQQNTQSVRELRQPAPGPQCASSPSWDTVDFEAMWNQLLPGKYGVLIPIFRNDRKHRDFRELQKYIPQVIEFLEAWDNVSQNKQPTWYKAALANYNIVDRLQWIFFEHDNPKDWTTPLPDAGMQVIFTETSAAGANAAGNHFGPNSAQPAQTQSNDIPKFVQPYQTQQQCSHNTGQSPRSQMTRAQKPILAALVLDDFTNRPVGSQENTQGPGSEELDAEARIREAGLWLELPCTQVEVALTHAQELVPEYFAQNGP